MQQLPETIQNFKISDWRQTHRTKDASNGKYVLFSTKTSHYAPWGFHESRVSDWIFKIWETTSLESSLIAA